MVHFQEGEDENDADGIEPVENSTLINDEESEHTMLLGRGINQQQYKGNSHHHPNPNSTFIEFLNAALCFICWLFYSSNIFAHIWVECFLCCDF